MRQSTIAQRAFAQSLAELNEHMAGGNFERAITICDYLSISHPGAVRVLRARAMALERLGDVARALDDYKRVLDVSPTDHRAMTGAARCQKELADDDEARELARQALDHDADNAAALALADLAAGAASTGAREDVATARALFEGGATSRAIRQIDKLLMRGPDRTDLQLVRAGFLWRSGRRVEAIEASNAVLYEKADALPAHVILSSIWRSAGADALANVHDLALDRLDPDGVERRDWMGPDPLIEEDPAEAGWAGQPAVAAPRSRDEGAGAYLLDTATEGSEPARHTPGPFDTSDEFLPGDSPREYAAPPDLRAPHASNNPGDHDAANQEDTIDPDDDLNDLPIDDLDPEPLQQAAMQTTRSAARQSTEDDEERAAWLDSLITSRSRAVADDDAAEEQTATEAGDVLPVKKLDWSPFRKRNRTSDPEAMATASESTRAETTPKPTGATDAMQSPELATDASVHPSGSALHSGPTLTPGLLDVIARSNDAVVDEGALPPWIERIAGLGANTPVDLKRAAWHDAPAKLPEPVIPPAPARKKTSKRTSEEALQLARTALENGDIAEAEKHYRRLVKHAENLNETVADLAKAQSSGHASRGLQRVLGDAYMRLGDTAAALAAYGSILEKPAQQFKFKPMGASRARKPRA